MTEKYIVVKEEWEKDGMFEEYIKELQSKKQYLLSLEKITGNEEIDKDMPPLLIDVASSSRMIDNLCNELNELHEENQELKQEKKLFFEILDAFINGVKDEKGIAPENEKFQYAMNEVLKYLIRLKQDLRNPNQYLKKRNDVELSTNNRRLKEEIK